MKNIETLLTLYVEDEDKRRFREISQEAGYSFEGGINAIIQRILSRPELAQKLLLQRGWVKERAVEEISVEELVDEIRRGSLADGHRDPLMIKDSCGVPYMLISAEEYENMKKRLECLEEKLTIHKNSP